MLVQLFGLFLGAAGDDLCNLILDNGVCLYSGDTVLMPEGIPDSLVGHWTFDDNLGLDSSGSGHHGEAATDAGPSQGGWGSSAHFSGSNYFTVPASTDFEAKIFTLNFWAYFIHNSAVDLASTTGDQWCPILQKGYEDSSTYRRTPAVMYDRKTRGVRVYVSTESETDYPQGEYVNSTARIPYHRWTHFGVVRGEKKIKLYINGVLDSTNSTTEWTRVNEDPLYFGTVPWRQSDCKVPLLMDDVRFYSRELAEEEIQIEAPGSLGEIEGSYLKLGCHDCNLTVASDSCPDDFHLCTTIELNTGAYQATRAIGWAEWNTHVWSHGAMSSQYNGTIGLGLCCKDLH
jgi:hypothetical protein